MIRLNLNQEYFFSQWLNENFADDVCIKTAVVWGIQVRSFVTLCTLILKGAPRTPHFSV